LTEVAAPGKTKQAFFLFMMGRDPRERTRQLLHDTTTEGLTIA
jgi:hypothetical protein